MILSLVLAATSPGQCLTENAHYALRHAPDVTAHFQRVDSGSEWPGGLALVVRSTASGRTSWWLPWNGGSDNLQHLASTTDISAPDWRPPDPDGGPRPFGDREFIVTGADYRIIDGVPRIGQPAPAHMLVPDAGSSQDPVFRTKQFFDLVRCSAKDR